MDRRFWFLAICWLGLLLASGQARAEERLAMVLEWKPVGGQAACGQRLEALLRQSGYRLVDESFPREKVDLLVITQPNCRQDRDRNFICTASIRVVSPASQGYSLQGSGTSLGSWSAALDEACREVTEQLAAQLQNPGAPRPPDCKTPG